MKRIIITFALILCTFSNAEAKLFADIGVTPEEFIACENHKNDPRCNTHIKIGCSLYCASQPNTKTTLQRACTHLCKSIKPIAYKPPNEEQEDNSGEDENSPNY